MILPIHVVVMSRIFINTEILVAIRSMYGIFTYIWLIFMVNVGKYTIHGSYGVANHLQVMEWSLQVAGPFLKFSSSKASWALLAGLKLYTFSTQKKSRHSPEIYQ